MSVSVLTAAALSGALGRDACGEPLAGMSELPRLVGLDGKRQTAR